MSAEFFDQRLASLKTDLKLYGGEIVDYVSSLYGTNQPDSRFELKNDAFSMLNVLQIDVAEILKESQQRKDQKAQHTMDIEECSQLTNTLTHISSIVDKIADCEALIGKMMLVPTCHAIEQLNIALEGLPGPNTEIGSGKVCSILRKECKLLNSRLHSKLMRILKESVQFEPGHIAVHQELRGVLRAEDTIINDPIALKQVWTAINLTGRDDEAVDVLLRQLWTCLVRPLWREKKSTAPRVHRVAERGVSAGVAELLLEAVAREGRSLDAAGHNKTSSGPRNPFSELGACKMPLAQLLDYLGQIFEFFYTDVLCGNQQAADSVAAKLNSAPISLMNQLINTISHHLPKTEPELATFRRTLESPCRLLEAKLRNFGFYLSDNTDADNDEGDVLQVGGPLSDYITDLPSIFADLRRREILKTAREVVLSDYHNTMLAMGDATEDELSSAGDIGDPRAALEVSVSSFALQKLKFDSCQTSLAACRLLKLINDVMRQAATPSASPQVAQVLFQSARDCLELFMAIVPMQFAHIIDHNARMGAVFYNDCLYIAHNCTLISHTYRTALGEIDPVLSSTVGFLDFIPRLRALGDRCLSRHIEAQRAQLEVLVSHINISPDGTSKPTNSASGLKLPSGSALSGTSGSSTGLGGRVGLLSGGLALAGKIGSKIKQGLTESEALYNINNSSGSDRPRSATNSDDAAVLVRRHLEGLSTQWLGVLQETVYAKLMGFLVEAVIREAMRPVLTAECIAEAEGAEICRVYRSLQHVRLIFPSGEGRDEEALARVCASWRKFLALTDLLEYSLTDVAEWLPRKKFASFTGSEVTSLIRALFEDTPRRQTILASILEMSS